MCVCVVFFLMTGSTSCFFLMFERKQSWNFWGFAIQFIILSTYSCLRHDSKILYVLRFWDIWGF